MQDRSKTAALLTVGAFLLFSLFVFVLSLVNDSDPLNVVLLLIVFGLVVGLQLHYLWRIHNTWESMTTTQKWRTSVAGVVVPILAAVAGVFLLAGALLFLLLSLMSESFRSSFASGAAGGVRTFRDKYGNRLGSTDSAGVARDKYGNKLGSTDSAGVAWDKYGNKLGSTDSAGVAWDKYGNKLGSTDSAGVAWDKYGNKLGSAN